MNFTFRQPKELRAGMFLIRCNDVLTSVKVKTVETFHNEILDKEQVEVGFDNGDAIIIPSNQMVAVVD